MLSQPTHTCYLVYLLLTVNVTMPVCHSEGCGAQEDFEAPLGKLFIMKIYFYWYNVDMQEEVLIQRLTRQSRLLVSVMMGRGEVPGVITKVVYKIISTE